jgi:formate hydrogenlyase subunit 3/multisubunit Na+/H+ antiporter MnhD subunit
VTAFFAATIGLFQTDIKKVLAYSTVSQLGYMFLAMGVGAYEAGNVSFNDSRIFQSPHVPWLWFCDSRNAP